MTSRYSFPKASRLLHKKDFEYVRENSEKSYVKPLALYYKESRLSYTHSRVGFSVSKKQGNSVRRNRLKRILREECRHSLRLKQLGKDILVVVTHSQINENELRQSFRAAVERIKSA